MPARYGHNVVLLGFLIRRLTFAAVALLIVAAIDYAMFDFPHGLGRAFLHLDFGVACSHPGCPAVKALWRRWWQPDVYLLLGGLVLGVAIGLAAAAFCASRPRSLVTRGLETLGLVFYSMPAYLFGFGVLLLFEPTFGLLPLPYFFHPLDYAAPLADPWMFVRAMVVPWIVLALPFAAVVMRLAQAAMLDEMDTDYVRTALAKGLRWRRPPCSTRWTRTTSAPRSPRACAGGG
jgi:ABC-type dipeptide/oligopeptide/nickel transport system permease component